MPGLFRICALEKVNLEGREMPKRDPIYDARLLRDLEIINEQMLRELGPLPARGLPVVPTSKSSLPSPVQPDPNI